MRTGTGKGIQDLNHVFTDTAAQVTRIPIEAVPDHDTGIITIITGVAHTTQIPHTGDIAINLTMTLHIDHTAALQHTEAHHTTPQIDACHIHIHHTNPHKNTCIGHTHTPIDQEANHITRRTPE